jgi:hypothetical protein
MTNQHPITPLPELVQQWLSTYFGTTVTGEVSGVELALATQAAQWGADQELEACITWLDEMQLAGSGDIEVLRTVRRPKPPSLRKQAYDALDTYIYGEPDPKDKERTYNIIRKALEALPND